MVLTHGARTQTQRKDGDLWGLHPAEQSVYQKQILREVHPMPTTEQSLGKLAGAKFVSKLDANSGF